MPLIVVVLIAVAATFIGAWLFCEWVVSARKNRA